MPRQSVPLPIADLSQFSRALGAQLATRPDGAPSHLTLMNMLARAAGFRNFQHLRAGAPCAPSPPPASAPQSPPEPVDLRRIAKVAGYFDAEGRLMRWPSRRAQQILCLWGLWARLPAATRMSEREISDRLKALHDFGDHAILRRELVGLGLFRRDANGANYLRLEQSPPAEPLCLIRELAPRSRAGRA
ncbi:DUF2087 domain-containing protein [Rhodobacter maris]|uniref:DUF2087 domain-containing protein n=1 Tax=Rhodobacter maris TaxID=446682 RepID=A0A285SC49_9RHOB|nr:DUF2087 domain-containing protein [Rhodobacter maris]SOC05008.1 hypothetical protein SAMN05877831_10489 [Rhodobacter maris]